MKYRDDYPTQWDSLSNKQDQSPINRSIDRATEILRCLSIGINTVTDIAEYCKYSTSSVHRLLQALVKSAWVVRDTINHQYYLGSMVTEFSLNQSAVHKYLIINALHEMTQLSKITEETINLAIMTQLRYVLLHDMVSSHSLRVIESNHGYNLPFRGATGRVLFSQYNDKEISEALQKINLSQLKGQTLTDKNKLLSQLKETRRQAYDVSYGEIISGIVCIAAPIKNYTCPAAIAVMGPESRLIHRITEITELLKASANHISNKIAGIFR